MALARGRQFFQNPGPTNIPDRILRAMDRPALDFMGAEFRAIAEECYEGLRKVFRTEQAMIVLDRTVATRSACVSPIAMLPTERMPTKNASHSNARPVASVSVR